ncbi:GPP34 family phosphoprotein [Kitasatospora sp. NPDC093558]|uniref:GOLPH3/VPS74 family protein n=1 Tax=Kitasatospora sp. NPDC093558 TaxID=3155201 RepID=UPI00342B22C7
MDVPTTLPEKLYLLAYDPERGRHLTTLNLDAAVRAAALTELLHRGLIRDDGRHPAAVDGAADGLDPLSAWLLEQIRQGRRRSWKSWIGRQSWSAHTVRDGLAADGRIRVEERRVLGIFPVARVTLPEPRVRKELASRVTSALKGPLSYVDPADAALVALADAAQLRAVMTWGQRREFRARIAKLAPAAGPVPRALRRAVAARNADGGGAA